MPHRISMASTKQKRAEAMARMFDYKTIWLELLQLQRREPKAWDAWILSAHGCQLREQLLKLWLTNQKHRRNFNS